MMLEQKMKSENAIEYSAWKIMDIKVLKATKLSFESTTRQFSNAVRIGAVKWKPNFLKFSDEMKSSFLISALDRSVRNLRFPWQFPSLNATFSKPTTKKQCFLRCFRCLSSFSAAVVKENLPETPAIVSLANFQILLRHLRLAFDWLSVSFFDYWPIRMSDLLLFFALN